tara:strand:- start:529 stop:1359 length:831 start_codon:yes stop_codon:yes gene_type:complete
VQYLQLPAPAKLNRFLHILGRRQDGYHKLQTVFQLLNFGDTVTFEAMQSGIEVVMPGVKQEDNLVYKAARLLSEGQNLPGVRITVNKEIPVGGGLGGGSSDAATALHGLNVFWNMGYSNANLVRLSTRLGADAPVFVAGETSWGEGIGDQLTPIILPETWYVVLTPGCEVSSAAIFAHPDLTRDTSAITIARFLQDRGLRNDCEQVARGLFPEIGVTLDWLSQWGTARMTGTGACVFLQTDDEALARKVLSQSDWHGFVTKGTQQSTLVDALKQIK